MSQHTFRRLGVASVLVLVFGMLFVTPMSALAYDRTGAMTYADYWALGRNTGSLQHYLSYGNDCTNFASQVLYEGGGLPYRTEDQYGNALAWNDARAWFWVPDYQTGSLSWTVADNMNQFFYSYIGAIDQPQLYWSGLTGGDIYLMDLENSGHPTHARVWMGYGEIYDNNNNPTGLWGDVADQHTTDRYHVAWDANWDPSTQLVWKIHLL